jgi:hypothetical protein
MREKMSSARGVQLPNNTRITHGTAANIRQPLANAPLTMHELFAGSEEGAGTAFRGQFGFIEFNDKCRLPRHVHISMEDDVEERVLLPERILVIGGVGLTELNGEIVLVGHGSLVDIPPGVPHTWNACPPGVVLPDGTVSDGKFTMIYEYSEQTKFYATAETFTLADAGQYVEYKGNFENIRFPELTPKQVVERATFVWNSDIRKDLELAA